MKLPDQPQWVYDVLNPIAEIEDVEECNKAIVNFCAMTNANAAQLEYACLYVEQTRQLIGYKTLAIDIDEEARRLGVRSI